MWDRPELFPLSDNTWKGEMLREEEKTGRDGSRINASLWENAKTGREVPRAEAVR